MLCVYGLFFCNLIWIKCLSSISMYAYSIFMHQTSICACKHANAHIQTNVGINYDNEIGLIGVPYFIHHKSSSCFWPHGCMEAPQVMIPASRCGGSGLTQPWVRSGCCSVCVHVLRNRRTDMYNQHNHIMTHLRSAHINTMFPLWRLHTTVVDGWTYQIDTHGDGELQCLTNAFRDVLDIPEVQLIPAGWLLFVSFQWFNHHLDGTSNYRKPWL